MSAKLGIKFSVKVRTCTFYEDALLFTIKLNVSIHVTNPFECF